MGVSTRALVTGGCGFIGVNLGRKLVARGWDVVAYDSFVSGVPADAAAAGMEVVEGDVRDSAALAKAAAGADYVVHLAAHTSVIESIEEPAHDIDVNVAGTLNALVAARDGGASSFVFASSNAPLGDIEPPVREDRLPAPASPYGAAKLAGEALCSAFSSSYGLPTTVLRFSNVYGPYSYHKGSVVALFMRKLIDGDQLVNYGDGEQTRDFVYVADLVDGIVAALESGLAGETFHLGSGTETSVNDLTAKMIDLFPDTQSSVGHQPARAGEILRSFSDISKAQKQLGFAPQVGLDAGLASTKEWFLEAYAT